MIYKIALTLSVVFLSACATTPSTEMATADSGKVTEKPKYETYVAAGSQLPLTRVTTIDGEVIDFSQDNSRKLIILFATWCSDSQRAMKALSESSLLLEDDLHIIAIARENSIDEVRKFQQEYNLSIDFVADVDRSLYAQFASAGIPRLIMVNKQNSIIDMVLAEGDNQLDLIHWQ
ncbi:MAG: TlpA family protein disulfide reductase [Gammaproteobacteria bacterium]|nr:TlpA family protein disulfide reductase [Gammaproteobacteria bacterium]